MAFTCVSKVSGSPPAVLFKNAAVDGWWVTLFFHHGEGELAENKIEGEKSSSNIFHHWNETIKQFNSC